MIVFRNYTIDHHVQTRIVVANTFIQPIIVYVIRVNEAFVCANVPVVNNVIKYLS